MNICLWIVLLIFHIDSFLIYLSEIVALSSSLCPVFHHLRTIVSFCILCSSWIFKIAFHKGPGLSPVNATGDFRKGSDFNRLCFSQGLILKVETIPNPE